MSTSNTQDGTAPRASNTDPSSKTSSDVAGLSIKPAELNEPEFVPGDVYGYAKTISAADLATASQPPEDAPAVVRAADLAVEAGGGGSILASRRIAAGETALVRPVTDQLVPVQVHWLTSGNGPDKQTQMVPCNGKGCVLCAAKNEAKPYLLAVLYFLGDGALGVISFARAGGPGSLRAGLVPLLARPDCSDLIVQISRPSKVRYGVKIVKRLDEGSAEDGADYGDDVLADALAGGGISPAEVRATITNVSNEELVETNPQLATVLAAYGKHSTKVKSRSAGTK